MTIPNLFQWAKPSGVSQSADYCTAAELKANSELNISDATDDTDLGIAITAASRSIDQATGRFFYQTASQARYYDANDEWKIWLDDFVSISELAVDDNADGTFPTVWTLGTDYQIGPRNAGSDTGDPEPYQFVRRLPQGRYQFPSNFYKYYAPTYYRTLGREWTEDTIRVTGIFGWPSVPGDVHKACMIFAARLFKRGVSALGVEATTGLGGSQIKAVPLDADIAMILNNRRKNWTG